ncbi:hypothetical protein FNF27_05992 [Cafeteria roenbergensis]|uniref:Uncharacterized protein n=1 Tax=Cafeteria roenbergensis TaxID=33653 RepID=A0A5A8E6P7_CAFRO|nr:hypothetical protein FNF28_07283 [Cafeteria roenbergensis]KAA0172517.1 hypothetical protein FNF27_05992 [Cafeteria roenbergensis]
MRLNGPAPTGLGPPWEAKGGSADTSRAVPLAPASGCSPAAARPAAARSPGTWSCAQGIKLRAVRAAVGLDRLSAFAASAPQVALANGAVVACLVFDWVQLFGIVASEQGGYRLEWPLIDWLRDGSVSARVPGPSPTLGSYLAVWAISVAVMAATVA